MTASVLLIQPPLGFEATYPLGLATIATALRAQGHRVCGIDMRLDSKGPILPKGARPDLIVVDTSIRNTDTVVDVFRSLPPAIPKIVVGTAAALHPVLFLSAGATGAVTGDAGAVLPAMLDGDFVDTTPRPGLVTKKLSSKGCPLNPAAWIDPIPIADRQVFPARFYGSHPFRKDKKNHAAIETTRGCPFSCTFCPIPARFGGNHRTRPVDGVLEEIGRLRKDFEVQAIWIEDEQPLADRDHVTNLLTSFRRNFQDIEFELPNGLRPDLLDDELIDELAASGCKRIAIGIESGSEAGRERLNRPISDSGLRSLVNRCRNKGIIAAGYFMIGLPNETLVERFKTLTAATTLDLPYSHISVFWPFKELAAANENMESFRSLGYAMIYLNPLRAISLAKLGDVSIHALPQAVARLRTWIRAGSIGGGGW